LAESGPIGGFAVAKIGMPLKSNAKCSLFGAAVMALSGTHHQSGHQVEKDVHGLS
jgi:hypothetical protein